MIIGERTRGFIDRWGMWFFLAVYVAATTVMAAGVTSYLLRID